MRINQDAHAELLNSAKKLFAEKGFDGVSVREIAADAKVHFALVRYHFGDKESLFRACIEEYGQARLGSALKLLAPSKSREDFEAKLRLLIEDIFRIQCQDLLLTKLVLREIENEKTSMDNVIERTLIQMAKAFVTFFVQAKEAGILAKEVDPQFLTHALQGMINHFVRTDSVRKRHFKNSILEPNYLKNTIDSMMKLILCGVIQNKQKEKL